MSSILKNTILITAATLLLCFLAFYNGFPILYPDSGTYIRSGFTGVLPFDRPIFYGLFIRHTSLAESPWLVILTQTAILTWLLFITMQRFVQARRLGFYFLVTVVFLVLMTGISYYATMLIPDVFTPVLFLAAYNLAFFTEHKWPRRILLIVIFMFAASTHLSHFPIIFVSLCIGLVVGWWRRKSSPVPFHRNGLIAIVGAMTATFILVPSFNAMKDGHFRFTPSSSVFTTNRLRDLDLVKKFLDEDCANHEWKLCPYRDQLYGDFLWDWNNSPLYKTGGWEENFDEYSNMNRQILVRPKFLFKYLRACFEDGSRQFFVFEAGPTRAYPEASAPVDNLKTYFPSSLRGCLGAKQIKGELDLKALSGRQEMVVFVSWALLLLLAVDRNRFKRLPSDLRWFLLWLLLFSAVNGIICASLSNVDPRYQGRMVWLFPFAALLVAAWYSERYDILPRLLSKIRSSVIDTGKMDSN